jgi:hypothetical protein
MSKKKNKLRIDYDCGVYYFYVGKKHLGCLSCRELLNCLGEKTILSAFKRIKEIEIGNTYKGIAEIDEVLNDYKD